MIMKTNSKVFVLLCGCILAASTMLTSCEDFLKEQNYGSPTKEEMTANESTIVLMVGQAYADVKWLHDHWGYWGVNLLTTDEGVCPVRTPGNHWADAGYWKNLNTHNWNAFGPAFENIWNTTISGAVLCNKLIYTLQGCKDVMSEANYNRYISELEVLRSYYYYMLFDCFGRIPYQEDFGAQTEPLMEPYAVWTHLVLCLEANKDKLPAVGKDVSREELYGRCSQGFAYALLARLYLNAESFGCTPENVNLVKRNEKAEKSLLEEAGVHIASVTDFYTYAAQRCESLIGGSVGDYQIEPNFFNNFLIKNENSKENIFVIVEDGSADFDYRDYAGSMANKLRVTMLTLHYCHQNTWDLIEKPWNGFCARSSFIKRYNAEDSRGPGNEGNGTKNVKQWGWFEGPVYGKDGKIQLDENKDTAVIVAYTTAMDSKSWLDGAKWNDGARMFKYEVDKSSTYKYCENDFVLFRLADVYWMNEEAVKRGGQGTSHLADAAFQTIMARAFSNSSASSDADRVAIFKEKYGDPASWDPMSDGADKGFLAERGREFAWENLRRRDLIRFGEFEKVQYVEGAGKLEYRRWFPIPYTVLEKAERDENGKSIWTQNPGYPEVN